MGIFAGVLVFVIINYIVNKFDIKHKYFLIGILTVLLVVGGISMFQIHNSQIERTRIDYEISEDLLDGKLSEENRLGLSKNSSDTSFIMFQTLLLKVCNKVTFLKLVNLVFCILSVLVMYRIINRTVGKKYAQIFTFLYVIFLNPIFYNAILSNQHIFLFFTLLAFDLLFEKNIIKNEFVRIGVVSLIISLANILKPEGIFFIVAYAMFMLIQIIVKKEPAKNGIIKLLIGILTFIVATFSVVFIQNQIIKSENIKVPYRNYFWNAEFNNNSVIKNEGLYWNEFSNEDVLKHLYDEEVKVGAINLEVKDAVVFLNDYCIAIWVLTIAYAIIGVFRKWQIDEKSVYWIFALLVLILHAFLLTNGMNAFHYRPYIFILAAIGMATLKSIIDKEENKKYIEKVKKIVDIVIKSHVFKVILLLLLCVYLTIVSLKYSVGELGEVMYKSYFENEWILKLNYLPIAFVAIFVYVLTTKVSISFAITAIMSYGITMINYVKMGIRNDNLLFGDIFLIKEAATTKFDYSIILDATIFAYIIFFILASVAMYMLIDRRKRDKKLNIWMRIVIKLILLVIVIVSGMNAIQKYYVTEEFYWKTKNDKNFQDAMWTDRNKYISRGCIYSFVHSYSEVKQFPPEGYNKQAAKKMLESYEYSNIDEDKKVNIISIMLESYNDFSKFEEIKFIKDPYKKFHEIEKQAVSGELVTSIFGGGTINTERKFISGASNIPNFRKKTNSYVYYFKEQGYTVEGSHPAEDWFYSRNLVNSNLGFDRYYFNENRYNSLTSEYHASDRILLNDILSLYKEHRKNNTNPYFSFSVTYQNHLPYSPTYLRGGQYIVKDEKFTKEEYNTINNYLNGVEDTGNQLYSMLQKLKNDKSPVVVILFGDHNPSLGSVYDKLGINFDVSTEEGFNNYYCTPYVIWANESAKKILGNNFVGKGEKISPNYLMNKFFELAGYGGNEFMKASNEIKKYIPAISSDIYYENDKMTVELSDENKKRFNEYLKVEYYYMNEFKNK